MIDTTLLHSDDHSVSSTVEVASLLPHLPHHHHDHQVSSLIKLTTTDPATITTPRRKQVTFDESANLWYEQQDLEEENDSTSSFWYTSDEYKAFKDHHIATAKRILRDERRSGHRSNPSSYRNVVERLHLACTLSRTSETTSSSQRRTPRNHHDEDTLTTLLHENLLDWQLLKQVLDEERVGMEKTTIRALYLDKKECRQQLIHRVLDIQDAHWQVQEHRRRLNGLWRNSSSPELVRRQALEQEAANLLMAATSHQLSQPSCFLAAMLAQAQHDC